LVPRIVLDTNVLVSGLLSEQGAPGQILDLVLVGELCLLYDPRILAEYRDVLARPRLGILPQLAAEVLRFLEESGQPVVARPWPYPLPDPDDEPFLAIAEAGCADGVVTGNLRHFPVASRAGVQLWSPQDFLGWIRRR
jgi:putative PIN family toxin of toxin-antitoxin system